MKTALNHYDRQGLSGWRLLASIMMVTLGTIECGAAIVAPNQPIHGISQAELSVRWWQWMLSYPTGKNPSADTTGASGSLGGEQSASVHPGIFFIAGNFSPTPDFPARTFSVPAGQYLFFPLLTAASSIPFFGTTEREIRLDAAGSLGAPSDLFARLNGADLDSPGNLLNYRQLSPPGLFYLYFPANNIFGAPTGSYASVSDGYFVGLEPLSPGKYELQFGGRGTGSGGIDTAQTIHLTVVPEPAGSALVTLCTGFLLGAHRFRKKFAASLA
jgi:hypothetical protein